MYRINLSTSTSAGTEDKIEPAVAGKLENNGLVLVLAEVLPDKHALKGRLLEILHRISRADPPLITAEPRLMEDIGIDSLGFYEILIEADTCFGIRIPEESLLQFRTVGDIQTHLESLELTQVNADNT